MATLKVSTTRDKAAFISHLSKHGVSINSRDIEDVQDDDKGKSYFLVKNLDDTTLNQIKDIMKDNKDIDIETLKELLRKIVREELSK